MIYLLAVRGKRYRVEARWRNRSNTFANESPGLEVTRCERLWDGSWIESAYTGDVREVLMATMAKTTLGAIDNGDTCAYNDDIVRSQKAPYDHP